MYLWPAASSPIAEKLSQRQPHTGAFLFDIETRSVHSPLSCGSAARILLPTSLQRLAFALALPVSFSVIRATAFQCS